MSPRPSPGLCVFDSSGWLEYLSDAPNTEFFAPAIEEPEHLMVPVLGILEVFKWVLRERGEDAALQAATIMQQGTVVDLDAALAIRAAKVGLEYRPPLADSITAHEAVLWTQDPDFEGLPGVRYRARLRA